MAARQHIRSGKRVMDEKKLYKRTISYLKPYRFRYLFLCILSTAGVWALFTCYGFLLREIVLLLESPELVTKNSETVVLYLVITLLASPVSGFATNGIKKIELKTAGWMRQDILKGWMNADEKEAEKFTMDDLQQRMSRDAASVSTKLCGYDRFAYTMEPVISGILSLAVLCWFNVLLAVVCFGIACVNLYLIQLKSDKSAELKKKKVEEDQEIVHSVMQTEDGRYEVHTFHMKDVLLSSLQKKLNLMNVTVRSYNRLFNARNDLASFFAGGAGILILLVTGALLARYHLIRFADVMAALPMIDQISQMMMGFGRWRNTLSETAVSEKRIYEIMDLKERKNSQESSEIIQLDHVSFSYDGSHPALEDCSLSIQRYSHTAVVGENGSGKSTLLKMMLGLFQPDTGTLDLPAQEEIAYMPQQQVLFDAPLKEYVSLSHQSDEQRINDALTQAGCADFVKEKGGINAMIAGDCFSGGQKQRLELARSLYSKRPYILMDEPSAALDTASGEKLEQWMREAKDKTIVVVTHRLDLVRHFDHIIVMKDHHISEEGTHDELMRKNGTYALMYRQQAKKKI
jgi:ABC-type multidrug transport system fused ATPase/permease subunit